MEVGESASRRRGGGFRDSTRVIIAFSRGILGTKRP
jgi:hypothetical protein